MDDFDYISKKNTTNVIFCHSEHSPKRSWCFNIYKISKTWFWESIDWFAFDIFAVIVLLNYKFSLVDHIFKFEIRTGIFWITQQDTFFFFLLHKVNGCKIQMFWTWQCCTIVQLNIFQNNIWNGDSGLCWTTGIINWKKERATSTVGSRLALLLRTDLFQNRADFERIPNFFFLVLPKSDTKLTHRHRNSNMLCLW